MKLWLIGQLVAPFLFMYGLAYLWRKRGRPKFRWPKPRAGRF